jgi:hypothetical protein
MVGQLVNDDFNRMWNEAAMAYIEVSYQNLPAGREKPHENNL